MKLSRKDFLKKSNHKDELDDLLALAEKAFKTWQPIWSPFSSAPVIQEISEICAQLDEINSTSYGGFSGAERQRILFHRNYESLEIPKQNIPIVGMKISGNFLFDPTSPQDFQQDLSRQCISLENIGDLWVLGDRGAQFVCTPEARDSLNQRESSIRTVKIKYEFIEINELQFPFQRKPRKISTVEASKRLDAIASAGFGMSRSKVLNELHQGRLRVNWMRATSSSQLLTEGDQLQLEGKGSLKVLSMQITKKERWKIQLLRK